MGVGAAFAVGPDETFDTNGSEFIVYDLAGGSITEASSFAATGQARAIFCWRGDQEFNNYSLDIGESVPVPVMAPWLLGALAGILGLIGAVLGRRFRR